MYDHQSVQSEAGILLLLLFFYPWQNGMLIIIISQLHWRIPVVLYELICR